MSNSSDLKIKSISTGNQKLQDIFNGILDSSEKRAETNQPLAQNLQSYENYLSRNVPKAKKNKKD